MKVGDAPTFMQMINKIEKRLKYYTMALNISYC